MNLILVARSGERLHALSDELSRHCGIKADVIATDLSQPGAAKRVKAAVQECALTVHLLVNNAGFAVYNHFEKIDPERDQRRRRVEMKKHQYDYKVVPYPKLRRLLSLMLGSVRRKHMIHGLIEVDVIRARAHLRDHKAKTGESLSFTAFITACLAQAIDENKSLQACRKGSKHLVLFDEVDVAAVRNQASWTDT